MEQILPSDIQGLDKAISDTRSRLGPDNLNENGFYSARGGREWAIPLYKTPRLSGQTEVRHDPGPTNEQFQSRFFTLPLEIRTLIYEQCFSGMVVKFCPLRGYVKGACGAAAESALPLLLSCRKISTEATPVLYATPTWWLLNSTVAHLPSYLPPSHLHGIRHITIHYHTAFHAIAASPAQRLDWLATWRTLASLRGLKTLDITLYGPENHLRGTHPYYEAMFLKPLAALTRPRKFTLRLRWPAGEIRDAAGDGRALGLGPDDGGGPLGFLPECCEVVREFEGNGLAESYRTTMDRIVTAFPHRYCLLGWEEDSAREPESINECFPIPSQEGQRKGFLRTYRSMTMNSNVKTGGV